MSKPSYQIIYINGPSSCGKSELCKALQEALEEPFLYIGVDRVIALMPDKLNDWTGGPAPFGYSWKAAKDEEGHVVQHLEMGPFAKKIGQTYKEIVLTLAKLGHYIIIDDVTFGKEGVDEWRELLKDYSVIFVGVHAPLEVIEERERRRGDRMIGSARGQYKITHQDVTYDLDIDTHDQSVQENAQKIINAIA